VITITGEVYKHRCGEAEEEVYIGTERKLIEMAARNGEATEKHEKACTMNNLFNN
jgi:hypothetical protein